jgi:hypothetical protein
MGLSLEQVQKGVLDWGTVIAGTIGKANEIIKETRGIVAGPESAQKNLDKMMAGTVAQQTATKGTIDQQVANATGGNLGVLILIVLGLLLLSKG